MNERKQSLFNAAQNDEVRCLAHGHEFTGSRSPVVVERPGEKHEVWCLKCAEHYGKEYEVPE